ncbi:MAG: hypothetical protein HY647_02290 [Acidobacteria bacterium]|nr:hypothetical protein [Acidobacteriota bacterium]
MKQEEKKQRSRGVGRPEGIRNVAVRMLVLCAVWVAWALSPAARNQEPDSPASAAPASPAPASDSKRSLTDAEIQQIIRRFAEKEAEFKAARDNYTYRQIVKVQELSPDGEVQGTHHMEEDIIFTPSGQRIEKVVYAPISTLRRIGLSPEDERDLRNVQPFVLTASELPKYNIEYQGRQKVDELNAYVFMVSPKAMEKGQRYFQGMIWVDERDLQIVKTYGKAVPDIRSKGQENLFPRFETYREQIDGQYWFPTWTNADDTLYFSTGAQRIRMLIRYENYKQFRSTVKITYGEEVPEPKPAP